MSATEIYDRFYDKMSEKQLNELLEMIENTSRGGINPEVRKTSLDYPHIKTHTINGFTSNPFEGSDNINVWHCCWKSFKRQDSSHIRTLKLARLMNYKQTNPIKLQDQK